jgi:plastocyanin
VRRLVLAVALAAAVSLTSACGGGSNKPAATLNGPTVLVRALSFDPDKIDAKVGETVIWKWEDRNPHNVTFPNFHSSTKSSGTYTHTFSSPGDYKYHCTLHPTMTGTVRVAA